jgi:hypothetical protein
MPSINFYNNQIETVEESVVLLKKYGLAHPEEEQEVQEAIEDLNRLKKTCIIGLKAVKWEEEQNKKKPVAEPKKPVAEKKKKPVKKAEEPEQSVDDFLDDIF